MTITPSKRKSMTAINTNERPMTAQARASVSKCNTPVLSRASSPIPGSTAKKAKLLNFKEIHERQFQNAKPITDVVKKDEKININMTKAMEQAKTANITAKKTCPPASVTVVTKNVIKANVHLNKNPVNKYGLNTFGSGSIEQKSSVNIANTKSLSSAAITSKISKNTLYNGKNSAENKPFKARPMPNFNKMHNKVVVNKENQTSNATGNTEVALSTTEKLKGVTQRRKPLGNNNRNSLMDRSSLMNTSSTGIELLKAENNVKRTSTFTKSNTTKRSSMINDRRGWKN